MDFIDEIFREELLINYNDLFLNEPGFCGFIAAHLDNNLKPKIKINQQFYIHSLNEQ